MNIRVNHSIEELRKARLAVAKVIARRELSNNVLKIFDRLDKEIAFLEQSTDSLQKALNIAAEQH